jgi:dihydrofolate reductase
MIRANVTALVAFDRSYSMANNQGECIETCKSDKKLFKTLTSAPGAVCIVGAKTFLNDFNVKELPNRKFLTFYRHSDRDIIFEEIEELNASQVFVIGGGKTYEEFLDVTNDIQYTHIFKCTKDPGLQLFDAAPTMFSIIAEDIESRLLDRCKSKLVQRHEENGIVVGYTRQIILR